MTLRFWDYIETKKAEEKETGNVNGHKTHPESSSKTGGSGYAHAALRDEIATLRAATEGSRNDQLNKSTFALSQLVAGGELDEETVISELTTAARDIGLAEKETTRTIRSGITGGGEHPRAAPPPEPRQVTVIDVDGEDEFWQARPELAHIHAFARARRASPWGTLGVVLTRVVACVEPSYVLPPIVGGDASLNLFVGIVGPSGAGKGVAEAAGADAVKVDEDKFDIWKLGSGQGLAHGYARRDRGGVTQHTTSVLFSMAEVDHMVGLSGQQGSTLLPELRSAWMGERLGHLYVDPTKRVPVEPHKYRATLIVGIQPGRAGVLLDDKDGGTPQRFVWLPAIDRHAPDHHPVEPEPLRWHRPQSLPWVFNGRGRLTVCQQARRVIDEARLARLRGHGDALDGHALFNRLKVATALALLSGRCDVSDDDWKLSATVMAKSDATRQHVVEVLDAKAAEANKARAEAEATRTVVVTERVEDEAIKRVSRRVVSVLERDGDWMTSSELRKTITSRDRTYVDPALERLTEAGQVDVQEIERDPSGRGGKGFRYRLTKEST